MMKKVAAALAAAVAAVALSVGAAFAETQHEPPTKKAAETAAFWCPLHEG